LATNAYLIPETQGVAVLDDLVAAGAANSREVSLNEKDQIVWSNDAESVSRQPARNG
jgi:hypothetical protein|tara:strand:- start:2930 stop:3100 length:171 start_codon:yes stop_codon:yes gene_type:complete